MHVFFPLRFKELMEHVYVYMCEENIPTCILTKMAVWYINRFSAEILRNQ